MPGFVEGTLRGARGFVPPQSADSGGQLVTTWMSAGPPLPPFGTVMVQVVVLMHVTPVAAFTTEEAPCVMKVNCVCPRMKFVPVTVTTLPPAPGPLAGLPFAIVGVAGVSPYEKYAIADPPGVRMSIGYAPCAAQQSPVMNGACWVHCDVVPQPLVRSAIDPRRYTDVVPG